MSPNPAETQNKSLPPPWDRIFSLGTRATVWAVLLAILYILRPFFLLIFLTFVFAYIQAHAVEALERRIASRPWRVAIVGLTFLGAIFATGYTMFPQIRREAFYFAGNVPEYLTQADHEVEKAMRNSPWLARLIGQSDQTGEADPGVAPPPPPGGSERPHGDGPQGPVHGQSEKRKGVVSNLAAQLIGLGTGEDVGRDPDRVVVENFKKALHYFSQALTLASAFLLALLFSFLIVLDMSKLERSVAGLKNTKVGFIYDEVAEGIHTFGKVMGRALEAQFFIAVANTILTGIGIHFMGLPNLAFLCTIVFLCSFIPVAGVFISSAPICLMALQASGFGLMLVAIGLILLIHTIEAYILNPKIFGHHLRMNPVLVLIVLYVGGQLFGVWGLVLGLPIVNYFFRPAIRRGPPADAAPA